MQNDFVFSAESCPVLTTLREEDCKIFFFSIDLHTSIFSKAVL